MAIKIALMTDGPITLSADGEDWIHPTEASVEKVIETVRMCPSGALTFTVDGKTEVNQENEFRVVPLRKVGEHSILRL